MSVAYRESRSGSSGMDQSASQLMRLVRITQRSKSIVRGGEDGIILGNLNIDAKRLLQDNYLWKPIANVVTHLLLEQSLELLVAD